MYIALSDSCLNDRTKEIVRIMKIKTFLIFVILLVSIQENQCQNLTVNDSVQPRLNFIFKEAFNNFHDTLLDQAIRTHDYEIKDETSLYVLKVSQLSGNLDESEIAISSVSFECYSNLISGKVGWFEYRGNFVIVCSSDSTIRESINKLASLNNFRQDESEPFNLIDLRPCKDDFYGGGVVFRPAIGILNFKKSKCSKRKGLITFKLFNYISNVQFYLRPIKYNSGFNHIVDSIGFDDYNISISNYKKGKFKIPNDLMDKENNEIVKYNIKFNNN